MSDVIFEEEKKADERFNKASRKKEKSLSIGRYLIKWGIVKNAKQAGIFLLALSITFFILSAVIFNLNNYSGNKKSGYNKNISNEAYNSLPDDVKALIRQRN